MGIAALMLGLVGGLLGLFCGGAALTIGCTGDAVSAAGAQMVIGKGCVAYLLSILGIMGWFLALFKPNLGGWPMLVAGTGSLIAAFPLYLVPGALLIAGGILTLEASTLPLEPEQTQLPGQPQPKVA